MLVKERLNYSTTLEPSPRVRGGIVYLWLIIPFQQVTSHNISSGFESQYGQIASFASIRRSSSYVIA
jgi:hypothetical protein